MSLKIRIKNSIFPLLFLHESNEEAMMTPEQKMMYELLGGREAHMKNVMSNFNSDGDFVGPGGIVVPGMYHGKDGTVDRSSWQQIINVSGIIWNTQGSGKSLIMVWLTKWIIENVNGSRVVIITDRDELDDKIEILFIDVDEKVRRAKSCADLRSILDKNEDAIVCSLIHKYGHNAGNQSDIDQYRKELLKDLPKDFSAKGNIVAFIDDDARQPWPEIAFVHALSLVPCLAQRFLHRIRALVPGAQISPRHPVQRALHGADLADKTFFLHSG